LLPPSLQIFSKPPPEKPQILRAPEAASANSVIPPALSHPLPFSYFPNPQVSHNQTCHRFSFLHTQSTKPHSLTTHSCTKKKLW
jgi:hypothetical protein